MPGAFGGAFEAFENDARELLPGALADLLAVEGEAAPVPPGLVPVRGGTSELRYRGDLRGLAPLERSAGVEAGLAALAEAARALVALGATGRAHGDFRPAHVWTGPRTVVSYAEKPLDAGALLRARLRHGADPRDVAFAAPEVVAGEPANDASDAFSLGAVLYWLLTGRTPHGRIDMPAGRALPGKLETLLLRALDPRPGARPSVAELSKELDASVPKPEPVFRVRKISAPAPEAVPAPAPAADDEEIVETEPIEDFEPVPTLQEAAKERRDIPVILAVVLVLGGILVLTGALWLVAVGWDAIGEWGRFGLLVALTGAMGWGGRFLETRGNARSGLALVVLSSQLLWAIGADLLAINGIAGVPGPWALTAGVVAGVGYYLAVKRRSAVLAVFASLGALMALVFTWQALDELGHCILLTMATIGLAGSAFVLDGRGHWSAPAVHFLWTQLLWLDGGYLLSAIDKTEEPGAWAVVAGVGAMGTNALAARRRSIFFAVLGALSAAIALLLTGAALRAGKPEGPAVWSFICAVVLGALGVALKQRVEDGVGAPSALLACVFAIASACAGEAVYDRLETFPLVWPYAVGAAAALAALALGSSRAYSGGALAVATLAFVIGPVFNAVANDRVSPACRHAAAVAGVLLLAGGVALRAKPVLRTSLFAIAVAHVSAERSGGLTAAAVAVPFLVAAWETRSEGLAFVGGLAASVSLVLFGGPIDERRFTFWAEWTLLAALFHAALALVGRARGVGASLAALAGLFSVASFLAALASYERALVFSVAWPYLLGALAVGGAFACARLSLAEARNGALAVAGLVLAGTPLFHGFREGTTLEAYRLGAPIAGTIVLVGSFAWPRLRAQTAALAAASVAGIAHVAAYRSPAAATGAVAFALLGHGIVQRSAPLGALGSLAASAALLVLGRELRLGAYPIEIAEWTAVGAVVLAATSVFGHFAGADEAGVPAAACAALFGLASWLASFAALFHPSSETLASFWPYILLAVSVSAAFAARGPYRAIALLPATAIVSVTPTFQALAFSDDHGRLYAATVAGTLVVVAAFKWSFLAEKTPSQILAILIGMISIATAPTFLALAKLADRNGDELFLELLDPKLTPADRLEHRLFFLPYLVLTAFVLVGLALLFAKEAKRRLPYRVLEVSGLAIFFGTLSLLSLLRHEEFLYPAVLFAGGFLSIAAGAWGRHVLLVAVPAVALILQAWFQYFAKLTGKAPIGLLIIGFGIGLLVGGVFFEKRVRHKLGELKRWA